MTEIPAHLLERARHARERAVRAVEAEHTSPVATEINLQDLIAQLTEKKTLSRVARTEARLADDKARNLEQECVELRNRINDVIDVLADPPTMSVAGMPNR